MADLTEPLLPVTAQAPEVFERVAAVDVFTGLGIVAMILVNDGGSVFPSLAHAPWDGAFFADYVMPSFLFIIGCATAITYRVVDSKSKALYSIVLKSAKLFLLGLLLQGGFFHSLGDLSFGINLAKLRFFGVLQRISLAFFLVSISQIIISRSERETPPRGFLALLSSFLVNWHMLVIVTVAYAGASFFLLVPDWSFPLPSSPPLSSAPPSLGWMLHNSTSVQVMCGVAGDFGPACNAAGFVDRLLLGIDHLPPAAPFSRLPECSTLSPLPGPLPSAAPLWCQAPFEPEGLLSSLGALLAAFCGLHFGHILTHFKGHAARVSHMLTLTATLLAAGWFLQFRLFFNPADIIPPSVLSIPDWLQLRYPGMPFNLPLFSLSFALFASGAASAVLTLVYVLVDVAKVQFYTKLFEWVGKNSLLVFVLAATPVADVIISGFYWGEPNDNLLEFLKGLFLRVISDSQQAYLAAIVAKIVFWALAAGLLHSHDVVWAF